MDIVHSKDGTLSIYRLVILDAVIVSLLGWLIADDILPLRPTALCAYPALLILNFVLIWRARRDHTLPKMTAKPTKRMWFAAVVFTAAAFVEIAYWVRSPDIRLTVQAIVGTALAGWMWHLALNRRGAKRED